MADFDWPKPDPVVDAVMRACEAMPGSRLVSTIPLGELLQFARALSANHSGVPAGEIVVTKNAAGQIVAVTRQDAEGRILEVIAESAAAGVDTSGGKSNG